MAGYRIAVFVGSLRKESINRQLARALEKLAGDRASFEYVQIGDLPLYNQDHDGDYPAEGKRLKEQVRQADACCSLPPNTTARCPAC
jgi:Predicted flavoprotein